MFGFGFVKKETSGRTLFGKLKLALGVSTLRVTVNDTVGEQKAALGGTQLALGVSALRATVNNTVGEQKAALGGIQQAVRVGVACAKQVARCDVKRAGLCPSRAAERIALRAVGRFFGPEAATAGGEPADAAAVDGWCYLNFFPMHLRLKAAQALGVYPTAGAVAGLLALAGLGRASGVARGHLASNTAHVVSDGGQLLVLPGCSAPPGSRSGGLEVVHLDGSVVVGANVGGSLDSTASDLGTALPSVALRIPPGLDFGAVVPTATYIRDHPSASAAAYLGTFLHEAIVAKVAVERHDNNSDRERFAQPLRSKEWKRRFAEKHPQWFEREDNGLRSALQYELALAYHRPAIRAAVIAIAGSLAGPVFLEQLNLARAWDAPASTATVATPGYCYLALIDREVDRAAAASQLGPAPTVAKILDWGTSRGVAVSRCFTGEWDSGARMAHVNSRAALQLVMPGGIVPVTGRSIVVPYDARVGAPPGDVVTATDDVPGSQEVRVRWVYQTSVAVGMHLPDLVREVRTLRDWASVRLVEVSAALMAAESGAAVHIGLTRVRRAATHANSNMSAVTAVDVARCEQRVFTGASDVATGGTGVRLVPNAALFDVELSQMVPPVRAPRPSIVLVVESANGEVATVDVVFAVSGGAFVDGPQSALT